LFVVCCLLFARLNDARLNDEVGQVVGQVVCCLLPAGRRGRFVVVIKSDVRLSDVRLSDVKLSDVRLSLSKGIEATSKPN